MFLCSHCLEISSLLSLLSLTFMPSTGIYSTVTFFHWHFSPPLSILKYNFPTPFLLPCLKFPKSTLACIEIHELLQIWIILYIKVCNCVFFKLLLDSLAGYYISLIVTSPTEIWKYHQTINWPILICRWYYPMYRKIPENLPKTCRD